MQDITLSIILVCWNNKAYLGPCLESLYEKGLSYSYDVWVVDNGSTDGSQDLLKDKYPQVHLIQNDRNVGLSKASNQGIAASTGKYVLLLNNDTLVNRSSLEAMVHFLENHPDGAAAGGTLLNPDGSVQATYGEFSSLGQEILIATGIGRLVWNNYPDHEASKTVKAVDWLCSACVLIRRAALDEVGLLDEQYFIYGDEVDLQYRLKKKGWKVYYLPEATTIHFGGRSMNRWARRKMVYRGKILFYQKNYSGVQTGLLRMIFTIASSLKLLVWSIIYAVPGRRKQAVNELRSNLDVIRLCLKFD